MGLLAKLSASSLDARKNKDVNAAFLALIISDVIKAAKSTKSEKPSVDAEGNPVLDTKGLTTYEVVYGRPATDDDAEQVIRATIKGLEKTLAGSDKQPAIPAGAYYDKLSHQINTLKAFLPEKLDEEALKKAIREAAYTADVEISIKSMGAIMKQLNTTYPGQIDGASVKDHLTKGDC